MKDFKQLVTRYRARDRERMALVLLLLAGFLILPCTSPAAVLPDDRADTLYHYYDGGGVSVRGPALLVRKGVIDNVSLSGRYYVDTISSASIDVVTTASPYKDKREEYGVGIDYLHGNSLLGVNLSSSKENDYLADSFGLNVSHDLPGGLTTIHLGYSQGHDIVQRVDTSFEDEINRYNFRLGVTQVLTRSLLLGVDFEDIAEEGYLSNPYRSARVLGASLPERYPRTRDSQAIAVRAVQAFSSESRPAISSLRAEYRYFQDNWGISSNTLTFTLQRYFGDRVLGEARYRYYQQSAASFYSDNFTTEMVYMARDKELSTFSSHSLGYKVSWKFLNRKYTVFDRMSLNFSHDYINFDYKDFTDIRTGETYSFGANVLQLYISAWY